MCIFFIKIEVMIMPCLMVCDRLLFSSVAFAECPLSQLPLSAMLLQVISFTAPSLPLLTVGP